MIMEQFGIEVLHSPNIERRQNPSTIGDLSLLRYGHSPRNGAARKSQAQATVQHYQ